MKTVILYASKYGATEKSINLLKESLNGKVDTVNLKQQECKDLQHYDTVLIAGSIYATRIQKEVKKCITDHQQLLLGKQIGLFICCKDDAKEKVIEYMKLNFPEEIVEKAFIKEQLGHEITLEKLNFFERFLLKSIFKVKKSYSKINSDGIKKVAQQINEMDIVNG